MTTDPPALRRVNSCATVRGEPSKTRKRGECLFRPGVLGFFQGAA